MDHLRLGLAAWLLLAGACGEPLPMDSCVCTGAVPGGSLDVRCGESACVGGAGYRCTGPNQAVGDDLACVPSSDGGPGADGGVADAASAADGGAPDDAGIACEDGCVPRSARCEAGTIRTCLQDARGCWVYGAAVACEHALCADPRICASCANECARAGEVECAAGELRSCVVGSGGCLEWDAGSACPGGFCGDARSCGSCAHGCPAEGATECSSGAVRSCVADAHGCRDWSAGLACAEGFCGDTSTCGACADVCSAVGGTECADGALRTCAADARGCLDWAAPIACADGFCGDEATCGTCTHECPTIGATECTDGSARACIADPRGCRSWGAPSSCADGFCADAETCGTCAHECAAEGLACASGNVAMCAVDAMGCRYETRAACGTSCDGAGVCAACPMHHDPIVAEHPMPRFSGRRAVRVGSLVYVPTGADGLRIVDVTVPSAPVDVGAYAVRADDVEIVGSSAVVVGRTSGLTVLDISTPSAPVLVASLPLVGNPNGIEIAGGYGYVLGDDLQVVDLRTMASPSLAATHGTPGYGYDLEVIGGRVFVTDSVNGIRVVDVSDPTAPALAGAIGLEGATAVYGLDSVGTQLLAVTFVGFSPVRYELRSFDTATAGFPRTGSASLDIHSTVSADVTVLGARAYVDGSQMVEELDVTDPARPSVVGRVSCGWQALAMTDVGDGRHLVCVKYESLAIVDLDHVARHLATTPVSDPNALAMARGSLLVAGDGLSIFDVSDPGAPTLLSRYATAQTYDVAVVGDVAYVAFSGRAEIVSIADPMRPTLLGTMVGTAREIAVTGGHAYVRGTSEIAVWDVRVPSAPVRVGALTSGSSAPNSVAASGALVVVGHRYSVDVWLVSDPGAPIVAGTLAGGGRVVFMDGATFYAVGDGWTSGDDFFRVVDVADPSVPTIVGRLEGWDPDGFTAVGAYGYGLRGTELSILDLGESSAPSIVDSFVLPGSSGVEDVAVHGAYVFATAQDAVVAVDACR